MRGLQFHASAANPSHPSHHLHNRPPTSRTIHKTPASYHHQLAISIPPKPASRTHRSWIHQQLTARSLHEAKPNSILHARPPDIDPDERLLPHADRIHLSRLRSGHHPALNAYKLRLAPNEDGACRWCHDEAETTDHLFNCPSLITDRQTAGVSSTTDIWTKPRAAAEFFRALGLM